jgi:hypothetical protein
MARPRTIKGSGPSVPIGPFRVTPEQRSTLEDWARRRGLLDKQGEPELGAAFRDLLELALAIFAADEELLAEGFGLNAGVERLLASVAEQFSANAPGRSAVLRLRVQVEPRTPAAPSASPADPKPRTESPK